MADEKLGRREFAAALVATGLATARHVFAQTISMTPGASRIPGGAAAAPYVPPRNLTTVADLYRRMTAAVMVNGRGPYPFIVDTGANQSVIAAELAAQLALPPGDEQPLNSVAGVQITPTAHASLQIGNLQANQAVLSVLPAAAIGGSGMLGLDQLDGGRLTLNFRAQTMSIEGGREPPLADDEIRLKAHRHNGQLTLVDADLAGIHITAFLDSGAQDSIGNMALRELAITRYPSTIWTHVPIVSVTGQTITGEMADLPTLRIGTLHVPDWPMAFADLHTFQMWNLTDRPAILIGVDILSRFETVCLDFNRDEVRLRLPEGAV